MGSRTNRTSAVLSEMIANWWAPDAQLVWSPFTDTDTTQVDPIRGNAMTRVSAGGPATASTGLWDMTSTVYNAASVGTAGVVTSNPFMMAVAVDRNNQATTFSSNCGMGGSSYVYFGFSSSFSAPIFRISLNSGAFTNNPVCSNTLTKGTVQICWVYVNPTDPTFQVQAGFNQTTVTQTGSLTIPSTTIAVSGSFGALYNSTTSVSQIKQGALMILGNRTGGSALTLAQCKAFVQRMQNLYGI